MKVLITRPQPDAGAFAAECAQAGMETVLAPLMDIAIRRAPVDLGGAGAVAFTSANGARAFAANCAERALPAFAVGEASAAAARQAGFQTVYAAGGDVDALAALIAGRREALGGAVLHAAGARRAGDLIAALAAVGVSGRRLVLYEAVEADKLPDAAVAAIAGAAPADWAALFSPASAALLARLVRAAGLDDRLKAMRAACLSEAVAAAARALDWRAVKIAPARRADAMIALMQGDA